MRVILVGPAFARERLRAQVNGSLAIVAEFPTIAEGEAGVAADAFLVAPAGRDERSRRASSSRSPREVQVLELLAEGLSNKAIAARLQTSDQTVKFHVAAISGKLGAHNRTEAIRLAVRRGLRTL